MEFKVRQATTADVDALAALNGLAQELHVAHEPGYFKSVQIGDVRAWFAQFLGGTCGMVLIAEAEGAPVGYIAAEIREREADPFSRGRRWCEVHQVVVATAYRGKGVSRCLIDAVAGAVSSEGVAALELSTWAFNTGAREAFSRLGFQPSQVRMVRRLDGTLKQ